MFNIVLLVKTLGYAGVFSIIFAESGLFFGFFLPGDSLLFTAGFLSSQGLLNIYVLLAGSCVCAIAGYFVGYIFGKTVGPKIFTKDDSLFFKKRYIHDTEIFFEKYGKKAVFLSRFLPIVRTFVPIVAGVGKMDQGVFNFYNALGGAVWTIGLTLMGFYLGRLVPNADHYITLIIIAIIVISLLPTAIHIYKERK